MGGRPMSPLTERRGRSATPVKKGASLASLSTANLTLNEIIQPHMPWKDSMSFLFEKVWTYITGDGLTASFYILPQFARLKKKREVMKTGVCGTDYCNTHQLKNYCQREYG